MKRLHSYYSQPFKFSEQARRDIGLRLKGNSDAFLVAIAETCSEYREMLRAEVPRQQMLEWRATLAKIARQAASVASTMESLDEDCLRWLDQYYVLDSGRLDARQSGMERLKQLSRVCARAAAAKGLNPPEGNPADLDRRRLASACAAAYERVTGREPKASPNGTFAQVLLLVLHAIRAIPRTQNTLSAEFLKSALARKSER